MLARIPPWLSITALGFPSIRRPGGADSTAHSGRLSDRIATRSPAAKPRVRRKAAHDMITLCRRLEHSVHRLEIADEEGSMKGNEKLIAVLNQLLADELTAINQYMVHSEMCDDWGYGKLHKHFEKRSIDEMKHAEKLIGRILFLDGLPIVSDLKKIHIGATVDKQLANDRAAEIGAIEAYNDAIVLAGEVKDYATRDFLQGILNDEDAHMDGIEALESKIDQMSLQIFLTTQVEA
jgi:bacterioferritin